MSKKEGLVDKYFVGKLSGEGPSDYLVVDSDFKMLGVTPGLPLWNKRSWGFVLSPEKNDMYGAASRLALLSYARVIESENPALANGLVNRIDEIMQRLKDVKNE